MNALVFALTGLVFILLMYIFFLQRQLVRINRQLDKRLRKSTRQPITIELFNRELNRLTANINRCLKVEENLRLDSIREEKRFKELIANISHDLRTPLTAIRGYQQLIAKEELPAQLRDKLQTAQKHADELGVLIEHFFEYAYLVQAEQQPNPQRIHLSSLVTECLAASIPAMEVRGISLKLAEDASVMVWADKEMTVRIVRNLIRNAIEHSGGDLQVHIQQGDQAELRFRNPVRNPEQLEAGRIFDRFYTADRARGRTSGLGLAIVRLLAEQMGGSASASLQDGELEVRIELPIIVSGSAAKRPPSLP
ncbi:HAMP domain-containing sensor histidine kinase [Paenibacillus sp. 1P07SE]